MSIFVTRFVDVKYGSFYRPNLFIYVSANSPYTILRNLDCEFMRIDNIFSIKSEVYFYGTIFMTSDFCNALNCFEINDTKTMRSIKLKNLLFKNSFESYFCSEKQYLLIPFLI